MSLNPEKKRAVMELERQRATTVTQAVIAKESAQQRADAELYAEQKTAEGKKFAEQTNAESAAYRLLKDAEANQRAKQLEADAGKCAFSLQPSCVVFSPLAWI
jgi:flotillin